MEDYQEELDNYYKNKHIVISLDFIEINKYNLNVILFDQVKLSRTIVIDKGLTFMSNLTMIFTVISNMITNYFRQNSLYKMNVVEMKQDIRKE